jgi:hypothetical protein
MTQIKNYKYSLFKKYDVNLECENFINYIIENNSYIEEVDEVSKEQIQ